MKTNYFKNLTELFSKIEASDKHKKVLALDLAFKKIVKEIISLSQKEGKVIFIGNGGSAAIANHISTDFLKNAHIPAMVFNNSSLITCISNDLGYEYVFETPISLLAKKYDMLFSISSSGQSQNILNATRKAQEIGCFIVTFSGFKKDNKLKNLGDINFYIPSNSYGFVEIVHFSLCHHIADILTQKK